jgi:hypothetical protein
MFKFINLWRRQISMSGNVGGTDRTFQPHTSESCQAITVIVPAYKKLKITTVRYLISGETEESFRLQIDQTDLTTWTTVSNRGEETPNFLLHNNLSALSNIIDIRVKLYNTGTGPLAASPASGWSVVFSIE